MRLAILGATSQIAKDLVLSITAQGSHDLALYARRPEVVLQWLASAGLPDKYVVADFAAFKADEHFDAVLNFVGVGNPAQAAAMGASIYDVTLHFDELALDYVRKHPQCRYLFLSSGAAYGSNFETPADADTTAAININHLQPQDWYGVAKLHAECRHRSLAPLPIIDIRVFNYFSHSQDMNARFLITDIVRNIREETILNTSAEFIVRDYIGSADFYQLVNSILNSPISNAVVDCYTKAPIDKPTLLSLMRDCFGLRYEISPTDNTINSTGMKRNYYSLNTSAENFGYLPTLTSLQTIQSEMLKIKLY